MKKIINIWFKQWTLFSIIGIPLILVGVPGGIYGLTLRGGASLGGVLILLGVLVVFIILIFDRMAVSKIHPKKLSVFELVFLILFLTGFSFNERKVIIDLQGTDLDYFILFENNGTLINSDFSYSFPFNKKIELSHNHSVINSISKYFHRLSFRPPEKWKKRVTRSWKYGDYKVRIYYNGDFDFVESALDSLVIRELEGVHDLL